jgi:hypothetical protein
MDTIAFQGILISLFSLIWFWLVVLLIAKKTL